MDLQIGRPLKMNEVADMLAEARDRTLLLVCALNDDDLRTQHDPLMSPISWDLGHIAHFEDVWLVEKLEGDGGDGEGLRGIYNPFEHPRATREGLPLPMRGEVLEYLGAVRRAALERIADLNPPEAGASRLLESGFVFRMVLQHEYQHNETILQTLQLKKGEPYRAWPRVTPPQQATLAPAPGEMVRVPGGRFPLGTDDRSAAYDNERPTHQREVAPFEIGAHPVTNGEYAAFVEAGGYRDRSVWSTEGWAWKLEKGLEAPLYWSRGEDGHTERFMDRTEALDHLKPVVHVCFWEAEAYATWAGLRLPTEAEWEIAASWSPGALQKRIYPWGDEPPTLDRANLDAATFGTTRIGSYPRGVSGYGCWDMLGNVWEWTSSTFQPYPGYSTFPYPEYSEVFFGDEHRVLRGGSWATRPGAIRNTFRNWDYPIRRQIFSGFRCARDV